jgi:hypothetical protein
MERYKLTTLLMTDEDVRVLQESLVRTAENEEVSEVDRVRARDLCERVSERFHVGGGGE